MCAAENQMYRLAGRAPGGLDDLLQGRMTAPDDENDPVRRVDRQRDFFHFQINTPGSIQQDQMKSGHHLGRPGQPGEIAIRPWAAETKGLGWLSVEVTHFRWKG